MADAAYIGHTSIFEESDKPKADPAAGSPPAGASNGTPNGTNGHTDAIKLNLEKLIG